MNITDENLQQIYQNTITQLEIAGIQWQIWEHEPILDFVADARIATELGWTAAPTKSLFLRLKDGRYCIYLTHRDGRLDSKALRELLGSRPSVCTPEEMHEITGCLPGAVCPFGLAQAIMIVADTSLKASKEIMFTPGRPELTIAIAGCDLEALLAVLPNPVFWLNPRKAPISLIAGGITSA